MSFHSIVMNSMLLVESTVEWSCAIGLSIALQKTTGYLTFLPSKTLSGDAENHWVRQVDAEAWRNRCLRVAVPGAAPPGIPWSRWFVPGGSLPQKSAVKKAARNRWIQGPVLMASFGCVYIYTHIYIYTYIYIHIYIYIYIYIHIYIYTYICMYIYICTYSLSYWNFESGLRYPSFQEINTGYVWIPSSWITIISSA